LKFLAILLVDTKEVRKTLKHQIGSVPFIWFSDRTHALYGMIENLFMILVMIKQECRKIAVVYF